MFHLPGTISAAHTWRKLLYLRQPFPDNYTHVSFLDQLKRNTTVAQYSYFKLFNDFSLVALYGLLLLLANVNFSAIYSSLWGARIPTVASSAVSLVLLATDASSASGRRHLKLYAVITMLLLIFSPTLRSLTRSSSLDSVWALSFILTCVNVVYHDYGLDPASLYKSVVSTNLSFANAIVLASRLLLSMAAFSYLMFSLEVCVLMPVFDFRLRQHFPRIHYLGMALVCVLVSTMLYFVHGFVFALGYLVSVAFVLFGLPLYFLFLQKYKNELQGPWDTAKPIFRSST
ncbi:phosphatidylinositol N-acetylglucosaminyltransferase [Metschnikowia bicuspidata var. bicuspidata NRRL YB-4993]|uniref:Phosphatidylinositol N-acetylglucosaminyltransferase n=1 Tax=Metschnikowia bicuspidata var. bicuspidata NRRL YB-4993 TaxID=869754 RepID=A0A1A0HAJ8_9ASCO|nr:phosphatidylinositol N-acetylglucosaminyltransferase [Metschnikowia bicuspidata var. bicuspidata NRRL YB-4993]OBA20903.1 phosphatidylinositol N-acetylglucosaminyltransferase [Metschnikowia bicuspidata var. bicuspidata NRRL YB-4993]